MTQVRTGNLSIQYNDKDITADISEYLTSFTYTDKTEGASDELQLELDDTSDLWKNAWYPDKAARLTVSYGYVGRMVPAGTFQIDEIETAGSPDTVTISALATGVSKSVRTKRSYAHEGKTLKQIAEAIAADNGFTVTGTIDDDIQIDRATQNRETDLAFLHRVAGDYGYVFSVRDEQLIFSSVYDLEGADPVQTIDRTDVSTYRFRDKTMSTYNAAHVKHHKPESKAEIETTVDMGALSQGAQGTASVDMLEIRKRVENELQATAKAKSHLHKHNSKQCTGTLTLEGNPYLVAGVNIELTGFGVMSGIWHITESAHTITKSDGYNTEVTLKRVGLVDKSKFTPRRSS